MKKRVLVTGASRGIGRAIALRLAQEGFAVTVNYCRSGEAAQSCLDEINRLQGEGSLLQFDVANRAETHKAIVESIEQQGPFWGVVANAGIARDAPFPALSGEAWDEVMQTNLTGTYNSLFPLITPLLHLRQGGRIVLISSVSGIRGNRGQANYAATKAGLIAMAKTLAQELGKRQITVNCVAPGLVDTEMIAQVPLDEIKKYIPLKRIGKPEEIAHAVAFLFHELSGYITGQCISVDGGLA